MGLCAGAQDLRTNESQGVDLIGRYCYFLHSLVELQDEKLFY